MKIYIHTYGRVGLQKTLYELRGIHKHVWLVVQDREKDQHNYERVIVLPPHIRSLSPTRQWLIENNDSDKFLMLDDDLKFYRRMAPDDTRMRATTDEDIVDLYNWFNFVLNSYMHASIASKYRNLDKTRTVRENARMQCVLGYQKNVVKYGRFDRVILSQDLDMTLQLLKQGYPNIVNMEFSYHQVGQSAGGVSGYRTVEMLQQNALDLTRLHPGIVKVTRKKETNPNWIKMGVTDRPHFKVMWQRAFKVGGKLI